MTVAMKDPPGPSAEVRDAAHKIASQLSENLPSALLQALQARPNLDIADLRLNCSIASNVPGSNCQQEQAQVISLDLASFLQNPTATGSSIEGRNAHSLPTPTYGHPTPSSSESAGQTPATPVHNFRPRSTLISPVESSVETEEPAPKRRKATGGLSVRSVMNAEPSSGPTSVRRLESDVRVFPQRKKNVSDNPVFQPSSLQKFVNGVWESIFSSVKMDPTEVIEQWQSLESSGQPKLLVNTDNELATRESALAPGTFGRMSILARKISQTSRTCRSLEVIVQAKWVQLFDDRVSDLSATNAITKEKAKKATIAEACLDFNWSEKELRNKMAIWRGYADIKAAGGWSALVFAGMGLYRFCKYRVAFTDDTFAALRALRHRFEVAADTLHPRWRTLLHIVAAPTIPTYAGHPHDWVVNAPNISAVPLPSTYTQWDRDFSYEQLDHSTVDEETWGLYDPRQLHPAHAPAAHRCTVCHLTQSEDPAQNACACFPALYPPTAPHPPPPVQVYRTPDGRNNGLLACLPFSRGSAVGEFVGLVTTGLANMDVMVGRTEVGSYQIWQGRQGNYTRFVNHSCQPNSQFERFVWMGSQRIVLVSKGIEGGEEVTVDYSDGYWKNLDKECLCGQLKCRYRGRRSRNSTPPQSR